ncbi:MAG: ATP-binding protein, partial [Sandaracinaceae bacterium]
RSEAPHRIVVEMRLDASLADGTSFFESCAGTIARLPVLTGQPVAEVEATIETHAAVFEVRLGPSTSVGARLRRAWHSFQDVDGLDVAVDELRGAVAGAVDRLRETTDRLEASERRWRALTDSLPGAVLVVSPSLEIVSAAGAETLPEGWLRGSEAQIRSAGRDGKTPSWEVAETTADGTLRWRACRAAPLPGSDGGAVVVAFDVTEDKRVRQALAESERRFLEAQRMEAIAHLTGGLAHDINNVLMTVGGEAELLARRTGDPEQIARSARTILDAIARASELTRRVLAVGRDDRSTSTLTDAASVIDQVGRLLDGVTPDDVEVLVEAEGELLVEVDPVQLEQALLNLCINARDAMPEGGTLRLRADAIEDRVAIEVSDTGVGMTEGVMERARDPFFSTKPVGEGSGLGLASAQWIVERAGGALHLESRPGEGTRARLELPRAKPAEAAPASVATPTPGSDEASEGFA